MTTAPTPYRKIDTLSNGHEDVPRTRRDESTIRREVFEISGVADDTTRWDASDMSPAEMSAILHTAFENAPVGLGLFRLDRTPFQVNQALCSLLGYSETELLASNFRDLTHPDDVARSIADVDRVIAGGGDAYSLEQRYIRKDGQVIWLHVTGSLVRDVNGTPRYFASQMVDITDRKEAEIDRAATHQRTRQVLERITDGFFALDREWCFTYVNEAAELMLGRTRQELLGQNVWAAFPEAVETAVYGSYQQAMAKGVTTTIEFFFAPLDTWFEARAYPSPDGLSVFFRDVSASRRVVDELRQSKEGLRTIVDHMPAVTYILAADEAQTALYFSPRFEALTGFTPQEALTRPPDWHWLETIHPEDRARVAKEDARTVAAGEPLRIEYRYLRKDGSYVWVLDECVPVSDTDGKIIAWHGSLLDISERVQAEEERARLARIVESAEDGILSCTLDGTITSWNHGAEKIYGYRIDEAIGRPVAMLWPPELIGASTTLMEGPRRGRSIEGHETERITKDGRRVRISLSISPIRDINGRIVGTASISRDVTSLRRAEAALRESEARFRGVWENTRDAMALTDRDGIVLAINPAHTDLYGFSSDAIVGQHFSILYPEVERAELAEANRALFAEPVLPPTFESTVRQADGTEREAEIRISFIEVDGHREAMVSAIRDVTDRKQLEVDLRQALSGAQAAAHSKSLFLAMMSHELRTPLQAILGYTDYLLLDPAGSLTAEQQADLEYVRQGALRMMALIDDLLDLSRMEAGHLELAEEPVDVAVVMEQVRQDIAPQAGAKALELHIDVPPALPPVRGNPARLRQILLNIAANAVKFTEVGSVHITARQTDGEIQIEVRDTGIGISTEDLPTIFEEFHQADSGLNRRHGGAGLGLAIAQRLAEQMGGSISVVSERGCGSVFTLHLPR